MKPKIDPTNIRDRLTNQQPKSPREWWILTLQGKVNIPAVVSEDRKFIEDLISNTKRSNEPDIIHVIEHSHHVAEVARLEAENKRIGSAYYKQFAMLQTDRDRWKSCAVKLAKAQNFEEMAEALKHFYGMEK